MPDWHLLANLRLAEKRQKSKIAASGYFIKKRFLTSNPIIKCDVSFLTDFGAWNPFDLKLHSFQVNLVTVNLFEAI